MLPPSRPPAISSYRRPPYEAASSPLGQQAKLGRALEGNE